MNAIRTFWIECTNSVLRLGAAGAIAIMQPEPVPATKINDAITNSCEVVI